ncbi:hypothetical protein C0J52_06886 [Blattella germanica]|nr:hypothetical protein C0J52_06886 [Blattella germanica]
MGAKASTANGGGTSPRARTFSTSSSSDVVAGGTGFSLLRAIPGTVSSDRQRARSLSSVPDSHSSHEAIGIPNSNGGAYDISESPETDSSSPEDHVLDSPLAANISLGRVYTAHSLPSHIWSLNGTREKNQQTRLMWFNWAATNCWPYFASAGTEQQARGARFSQVYIRKTRLQSPDGWIDVPT